MTATMIFIVILIVIWIGAGMRLFSVAHRNRLPNLYWLTANFFMNAVSVAFAPVPGNPLGNTSASAWLHQGLNILTQFVLIPFIHATFYQDKKSPAEWFWGITILCSIGSLYGIAVSESNAQPSAWVALIDVATVCNWLWFGWAGYRAWRGVMQERTVEDWVKARYQLILVFCVLDVIAVGALLGRKVFVGGTEITPLGQALTLVSLVGVILNTLLQYVVWAMPEGFRKWLNRNYRRVEYIELTEEELMRHMAPK